VIGKIFRGIGILIVVIAVAIGALFAFARFHDGPLGPLPGGALVKGTPVTEAVSDWSFAKDIPEIELQLAYEKTSRTTWIAVVDGGKAYVPCATKFPPGKRWYKAADQNGEAVLRIGGKLYPVTLTRVKDDAVRKSVGEVIVKKYPNLPPGEDPSAVWFFEVASRPAAS
jgi:hypothetical protein